MKQFSVLVVDDEVGVCELIGDALSMHGHHVTCRENGVEALDFLAGHEVDVVFLDIRMPKGDGLTALKKMRKRWPSLPVVMITGCNQREVIDQSLQMGPLACLVKPFSMRDVLDILGVLDEDSALSSRHGM